MKKQLQTVTRCSSDVERVSKSCDQHQRMLLERMQHWLGERLLGDERFNAQMCTNQIYVSPFRFVSEFCFTIFPWFGSRDVCCFWSESLRYWLRVGRKSFGSINATQHISIQNHQWSQVNHWPGSRFNSLRWHRWHHFHSFSFMFIHFQHKVTLHFGVLHSAMECLAWFGTWQMWDFRDTMRLIIWSK